MFSATDVANFLSCHHLLTLDRAEAAGIIRKPYFPDPGLELLRELGTKHEQAYFRHLLNDQGLKIFEIPLNISRKEAITLTQRALFLGVDAIYQAALEQEPWFGRPDFLVRVPKTSALGRWSYEVVETKLARSAKVGALIQLCFYSDLLSQIQKVQPDWMHVVLGRDLNPEKYPVEQYIAYFRKVKRDFDSANSHTSDTYPEPVEHCRVCSWDSVCDKRRRNDDHLSLVAGITRNQRKALAICDVTTVADLAKLDSAAIPKIDGVGKSALLRISQQARLQVQGRQEGRLVYEFLDAKEPNSGLSGLPEPSAGDIFLDLEGDPYVFEQEFEYLIGILSLAEASGKEPLYQSLWSFDSAGEREAFRKLIALVMERWHRYSDMHIYHYAPYEPTAIKRLAGRHGICTDEVDLLLRGGVFIDLYRIVREGFRISVESYSIKKLEPLYGFTRAVPPQVSILALQTFGTALLSGNVEEAAKDLLPALESYNRDDCVSAYLLRQWLEDRRHELETKTGKTLPRPELRSGAPPEDLAAHIERVRAVMVRLTTNLPAKEDEWTIEHRALWLLAQMLEYHRREDKSAWWEYFRLCEVSSEELLEDKNAIGGLVYVGPVGQVKRSIVHRYRFPPQEHSIGRANAVHDPKTKRSAGETVAIDDSNGTIDLKRGVSSVVPHPAALIPQNIVGSEAQCDSLLRIGTSVADRGISGDGPFRAARDILLRQPPRASLVGVESLIDERGQLTDAARQVVASLTSQVSVLPVQGPPGSGKTFTGARIVTELLKSGKRVGITAVSHKVISNLLDEVCKLAKQMGTRIRAVQKANDGDACSDSMVTQIGSNEEALSVLTSGAAQIMAGTPWLWARKELANSLDVLLVDEAGQMSLADVLAISQSATSLVLLGDPQQLNQPQRGVHPPGVDMSALAHLLNGRATVDPNSGLFLKETWRLHPDICAFTSELFYDSRLAARQENQSQRLNAEGYLDGSGLRFVGVEHSANQNESPEEAEKIAELIEGLLRSGATWTNKVGETLQLELKDILVVAPYNAQVSDLIQKLPAGTRVGTVDKFQGQQAPLVFYSMTTSTPEEAPRGMEFLYSLNRLNVAISRAQCAAVIVACPALFHVGCKTPRHIKLANAFCRYLEMAKLA
jgi:predicted RecB family nuclease